MPVRLLYAAYIPTVCIVLVRFSTFSVQLNRQRVDARNKSTRKWLRSVPFTDILVDFFPFLRMWWKLDNFRWTLLSSIYNNFLMLRWRRQLKDGPDVVSLWFFENSFFYVKNDNTFLNMHDWEWDGFIRKMYSIFLGTKFYVSFIVRSQFQHWIPHFHHQIDRLSMWVNEHDLMRHEEARFTYGLDISFGMKSRAEMLKTASSSFWNFISCTHRIFVCKWHRFSNSRSVANICR